MRGWVVRHQHVAAALLFAAMAIVFVGPGLLPGKTLSNSDSFWFKAPWGAQKPASLVRPANPEYDDAPAVLQPFVRFTKRELPDVPLWNPNIMTGRPYAADAQSAIFSPFNVVAYVLPFWTALGWIMALKLWVAAFGTFLLGRALGMGIGGALFSGTTYGFCLWLVTWQSYPHASVWALIPLLLVAADRAIRRPTVLGAAPLAALTGVQLLCGHPESSFHAALATVVFAGLRLRQLRLPWRAPVLAVGSALAAGLALAAVSVIPFTELLLRSADLSQRRGTAIHMRSDPAYAIEAFLPDWQGRPTQAPLQLFLLARAWYGGALALMLAAGALIMRPVVSRLVTAIIGASCMAVVFGSGPIFQVVARLPLFSSGHNGRLAIIALLCLALLAGWGLDDLLTRASTAGRRRAVLIVASVLFAMPLVYAAVRGSTTAGALADGLKVAWGFEHPRFGVPDLPDVVRASALWIWVGVAGIGLALIALLVRAPSRIAPGVLAAAAVALAFGDLARAGIGYNPVIDKDIAVQPDTPAIRQVRAANPARFVATGDIPQDALPMNHGLYEARGYDLPLEKRYDRLWRTRLSPEFPSQVGPYPQNIPLSLPKVDPARLRVLGLLGTRYVMQPLSDPVLRMKGLELVHRGPDARLYRNRLEQPRAVVVEAQRVVGGGEAALNAVTAPGFAIDSAAVTEKRVDGLPVAGAATRPTAGVAHIDRVQADTLDVSASAPRGGMLVVSDAWDPGWKATVDGADAKVERVDYVMRGVKLPPGRHHVVFSYRPLSWRIGWIVSLVALLALAGAVGLAWKRERR